MLEVWNSKKRSLEPAKCRHCELFEWSSHRVRTGYCFKKKELVSNNMFACSSCIIKAWLSPPRNFVQLNLFDYEKSV